MYSIKAAIILYNIYHSYNILYYNEANGIRYMGGGTGPALISKDRQFNVISLMFNTPTVLINYESTNNTTCYLLA